MHQHQQYVTISPYISYALDEKKTNILLPPSITTIIAVQTMSNITKLERHTLLVEAL